MGPHQKIVIAFKKGDKTKLENYKPVSNLCAFEKVFERLISKRTESKH